MGQHSQQPTAGPFWNILKDPPTNWSKRRKISSVIVFLIGLVLSDSLTKGYILSLFLPYGHDAVITGGILRVVGTIVIVVPTALIIFYKLKSYCMTANSGKRLLMIIGSIVLVALFVVYSYKSIAATNEFYRWQEETRASGNKKLLQIINNEVPSDESKRSKIDVPKLTYLYAKDVYVYEGRIIEYRGDVGSMRTYAPTSEDQKTRDNLAFFRVYTDSTKVNLIIFDIFAVIAVIGALTAGTLSRKKISRPA
jgi:hypothetical protein